MQNAPRLSDYPRREWRILAGAVVLTVGAAVATALQPWPLKLLVDRGLSGNEPAWIAWAALASVGVFAVQKALEVGLAWTWTVASQRMVYRLAADLFHRFQRLSLLFHMRQRVGDLLTRLTGDTWAVATVAEAAVLAPVRQALTLISVGVLAWQLEPRLTMLSLAVAPVLGVAGWLGGRSLRQRAQLRWDAQSALQSFVHQTLGAIPLVQTFGLEPRNRAEFDRLAATMRGHTQREAVGKNLLTGISGVALAAGTGLVLYVGSQEVVAGKLTVGSLLVFLGYLRPLQLTFQGLLESYGRWQSAVPSLVRLREIMEAAEEVPESPTARPFPADARGRVELVGVNFGYDTGRPVLRDISLVAEPGEVVALVGPTGAGKTTLAGLIPRLFDPQSGRVLVDGVDVRDLQITSLRAHVSVVLQEPFLLPLTVAQNIAYSRPAAGREEIIAAARQAQAHEFIEQLPAGYDTPLGERGVNLSGGQRQRVAIARAFLKNAPVLILDEPSSALDRATEEQLMTALAALVRGRTTFIIAHRFSTIQLATRIAVMDGGRLVEWGTHAELWARNGLYRQLAASQTGEVAA